jgi:hypothetical protein
VLDRRERRRRRRGGDQTAFGVRWEVGRRPSFGEVSVREKRKKKEKRACAAGMGELGVLPGEG